MKKLKKKMRLNNEGFTLVELMVSTGIMVFAFVGVLLTFIRCVELSEMASNSSIATTVVKSRMELINNTPFSSIVSTYDDVTFTITGLTGIGVSYVDVVSSDLLLVTISFCWQEKNGRVIGEDANLNGNLDSGEDLSPYNNKIDSYVQIVNYIYDE